MLRSVDKKNKRSGLAQVLSPMASYVALPEAEKRTDIKLGESADAQKATDRSLKALIDSLRNGRNGR